MATIRNRASEDETLKAWDNLCAAIKRVECAQPSHMSAAILILVEARESFDRLMLGVAQSGGLAE